MSEVILIRDSSDEESSIKQMNEEVKEENPVSKPENGLNEAKSSSVTLSSKEEDDRINSTELTNELFEQFIDWCSSTEKSTECENIMKFLRTTLQNAANEFKSSRRFRKILQKYIAALKNGSKDVYVYMSDVISELEGHGTKRSTQSAVKHKIDSTSPVQCSKKLKKESDDMIHEESVSPGPSKKKPTNDSRNGDVPEFNSDIPSTSANAYDYDSKSSVPVEHAAKIKYLENLLHKLSKEITRLQNRELSLEELDREDSTYIQEGMLKARAMKVYKQLCLITESPVITNRISEKRIAVRSSRFEEINRRVQRFINNPGKNFLKQFPNFRDILCIVKQANTRHKLNLPPVQLKNIALSIFEEVGEKLQKRRKMDFLYEFGNVSNDMKVDDPADSNKELDSQLKENGKTARTNLDSVIEKYTKLQHNLNDSSQEQQAEADRKDNEDDDDDDNPDSPVSENEEDGEEEEGVEEEEEEKEEEECHEEDEVIVH